MAIIRRDAELRCIGSATGRGLSSPKSDGDNDGKQEVATQVGTHPQQLPSSSSTGGVATSVDVEKLGYRGPAPKLPMPLLKARELAIDCGGLEQVRGRGGGRGHAGASAASAPVRRD